MAVSTQGWLGLATAALVSLATFGRSGGAATPPPVAAREAVTGQWIWTARDRQLFERARVDHPALSAALLIGSFDCDGSKLRMRRGLSPLSVGKNPRALLIRVEDSVNRCLNEDADRAAQNLDDALAKLLREVKDTGASFSELQLDYDSPVSKLPRYAALLARLKRGSLRDVELWITSIPVHVEQPRYGELMRGLVAGHILQLFDTGLRCEPRRAETLRAALAAQALPYRLGYGAFERLGAPEERSHVCWQELTAAWRRDAGASGFWIFPAGLAYEQSLTRLEGAR
ncbi:MAG TPA: DUF3142 domain-containing protein [Polyangiaceae bacterium]|nr:DUF3142 domain-containing protein [Polyangiaceae bacterium]